MGTHILTYTEYVKKKKLYTTFSLLTKFAPWSARGAICVRDNNNQIEKKKVFDVKTFESENKKEYSRD